MTSEVTETTSKMTASTPKENQHNPSSTNCPPVTPNPYNRKKTYKQALLAEVEGANNRTGVDTFKLVHLVQKQKQADDEQMDNDVESVESDNTTHRTNGQEWYTSRFRFQITLMETQKETYMDDLISQVNQVLEVLNLNTPGVKLAPWHTASAKSEDLRSELSDETMEAIKYLYGFKAGMTRPGAQYFRINLAIPSRYTPDDVERKNKNSIMIPGQQSLLKANSQVMNPITIGWLLHSNPMMADTLELEQLLRIMWDIKGGFGLYWATVKTHQAYDPQNTTRAIHIETEEEHAKRLIFLAEKVYGVPSTNLEDYPLGISMMFIKHYNLLKGVERDKIATFAMYQKTNEAMLTSTTWKGSLALDRSISSEKFESFRHWMMSMTSLVDKPKKDGTKYKDKLFLSIHRSDDRQETQFYFYRSNATEASNVISALPLVVKHDLGLDPSCFFHKADYLGILDGTWNSDKREFKNKQTLNQEQFLQDLDDCFLVNKEFLPEVVIMGQTKIDKDIATKNMAMANGEDEVLVLSNLTEKTLKASLTRSGNHSPSESTTNSQQSGNTTKSKTQAAVKEALRDVSIQHNQAMKEQQEKFRKEIEALRKALETKTAVSPQKTRKTNDTTTPNEVTDDVSRNVEDSSDDEASMKNNNTHSLSQKTNPKSVKSPVRKRAKRGRGGRTSSSTMINE